VSSYPIVLAVALSMVEQAAKPLPRPVRVSPPTSSELYQHGNNGMVAFILTPRAKFLLSIMFLEGVGS
jgi:hypothetical protein